MKLLRALDKVVETKEYTIGINMVIESVHKCRELAPEAKVGVAVKINTTDGLQYIEDLSDESKVAVAIDCLKEINTKATSVVDTLAEVESNLTCSTVTMDLGKRNQLIAKLVAESYLLNNISNTFDSVI